MFLSTKNAASWTQAGLANRSVYALAVSGTSLFAGTGGGGVYMSTTNSTTWTGADNGLTNTTVHSLCVNGNNIFAGTGAGVFLSTND